MPAIEASAAPEVRRLIGFRPSLAKGTVTAKGVVDRDGYRPIDGPEACDGEDLGGQTCATQGFFGGELACNPTCTGD